MKITVVGAGKLGAATAFSILHQTSADEIVLLDIVTDLAKGQAMDLEQAAGSLGKKVKVYGGDDYSKSANSDVVVITAGKPRTPDITRLDLTNINSKIVESIVQSIMEHSKEPIIIIATNPVDVMAYVAFKASGLPRNRVFGEGGMLDTSRLIVSGRQGIVIGEHGDSMVPLVADIEQAKKDITVLNKSVLSLKKGTEFAPAASIGAMAKAVLEDSNAEMPCSCVLDGEYGLSGLSIGVLASLSSTGCKVITQGLTTEQLELFKESARKIKECIPK